jgi:hypothetical protein
MVAYAMDRDEEAKEYFGLMAWPELTADDPPSNDPRRSNRLRYLVLCPYPELQDLATARAVAAAAFDEHTTNPNWWTLKAILHHRMNEAPEAVQALAKADKYYRSANPLNEVARLLIERLERDPSSYMREMFPNRPLPLEAKVLMQELLALPAAVE